MRRTSVLAPLLAIAAAFAGCGGSAASNGLANESPAQILQAAVTALRSAQSVHIKGTVGSGPTAITIDATSFSNGDLSGTIGENGATAQLVKIGGTDYIRGPAAFWTAMGSSSSQVAAVLADRWVSTPDGQGAPGIGNTFTMSALGASLLQDNGTVTRGSTATVAGQPAVSITSSNGGVLWVATTGTPFVVQVVGTGSGSNGGQVTFSEWNQGAVPTPPAGAVPASSLSTGSTGQATSTTTTVPGGSGTTGGGSTTTTTPGTSGTTGGGPTGRTGVTGNTGTTTST